MSMAVKSFIRKMTPPSLAAINYQKILIKGCGLVSMYRCHWKLEVPDPLELELQYL